MQRQTSWPLSAPQDSSTEAAVADCRTPRYFRTRGRYLTSTGSVAFSPPRHSLTFEESPTKSKSMAHLAASALENDWVSTDRSGPETTVLKASLFRRRTPRKRLVRKAILTSSPDAASA